MPATYAVADANGTVMFWGPVQKSIRPLPSRPALWTRLASEEQFGDMNGPIAYGGPAPIGRSLPAARVA
jgi:hypothetical protein